MFNLITKLNAFCYSIFKNINIKYFVPSFLLYSLLNFKIMNKSKYQKFKGQDKFMVTTKELAYTNLIYTTLTYKNSDGIKLMKERLKTLLDNKNHRLRYRTTHDDTSYYLSTLPSINLIDQLLYISHEVPTKEHMKKTILESKFGFILFMTKDKIIIVQNHLLVDGVRAFFIFGELMDKKILDEKRIPKFNYTPIITECFILKNLYKIIKNTKFTPQLKNHYNFKQHYEAFEGQITGSIDTIKNIKKENEATYGQKISFPTILSTLLVKNVFNTLTKNKNYINLGIITAFSNNTRFNNFSLIMITVYKPEYWSKLSDSEQYNYILKQIHKDMTETGKAKMCATYLVTNIYNIHIYSNHYIDVLVANLPTNNNINFGNKLIEFENFDFKNGTSCPLYCNMITNNSKYKLTYEVRTNDIDYNQLFNTELNVK